LILFNFQKLYTYPDSFRTNKALIAAQYSGRQNDFTVVSEPPEFVLGKTNKSAEFLEKFPLGKVGARVGGKLRKLLPLRLVKS